MHDSDKLESVQSCAAQIVTGLHANFCLKESAVFRNRWETLQTRRYIARMTTMFKINMGFVSDYLFDIISSKRENISHCNTRNKDQFNVPKCRLDLFKKSFVPKAVNQ